jgi:tetratricopeptide (TPR) repeat protein
LHAAGRHADAIREYEKVLARANERIDAYDGPAFHQLVLDHYWLGVAYQENGNIEAARHHLEIFLSHWRQPDGTPAFYSDAKRRLNVMGAVPPRATGNPTPAT